MWEGGTRGAPLVRRAGCRQPGRCPQCSKPPSPTVNQNGVQGVFKRPCACRARAASLCELGGTRKPAAADLWADACVAIASRASSASFMAAKCGPNRLGTIKPVAGRGVLGAGCLPTQFVEMAGDELTSNEPGWVPSMGGDSSAACCAAAWAARGLARAARRDRAIDACRHCEEHSSVPSLWPPPRSASTACRELEPPSAQRGLRRRSARAPDQRQQRQRCGRSGELQLPPPPPPPPLLPVDALPLGALRSRTPNVGSPYAVPSCGNPLWGGTPGLSSCCTAW